MDQTTPAGGLSRWGREIRSLPGGELILAGQRATGRLLAQLPGLRAREGGSLDGWYGVARHGNWENLVLSEQLHDELEFLRRHFDGEQLYLARHSSVTVGARRVLCWRLTPAALGAPRRLAIGLALACNEFWRQRGVAFQLLVNADRSFVFASPSEVGQLLVVPPSPTGGSSAAWRRGFLEMIPGEQTAGTYWITCDTTTTPEEWRPSASASRSLVSGLFVVEIGRLRYLELTGDGKSWREVAAVRVET